MLSKIVDAMQSACRTVQNNPIIRPRPNEVGDDVGPVTIRLIRKDPNSARPDTIEVEYSINGKEVTIPFVNEASGGVN